jgi:hypothetical protein
LTLLTRDRAAVRAVDDMRHSAAYRPLWGITAPRLTRRLEELVSLSATNQPERRGFVGK